MIAKFEEQYEAHSERLVRLTARQRNRKVSVFELAQIASCRKVLAETAWMLQCAAASDFGRCQHCLADIPLEQLAAHPEAQCCLNCGAAAAAVPA